MEFLAFFDAIWP